ncbi:MAG TPA: glycosyltransferase family 25 protein [Nitrososphaerales archaeon]|nr:glycosyltransferase family 25 protein [Nitrososphaerales archaeon]
MRGLKTYVINLRRRTDRRRRVEGLLPEVLEPEFTSDWDLDFDWRTIPWGHLKGIEAFPWKIESNNPWWNRPLKKGEVACAMAHFECWSRGETSGERRFLVLEDDVSFDNDFSAALEPALEEIDREAPEWHLLYLGRERLSDDVPFSVRWVRPGYSYGAYGYVLSRSGASSLIRTGYEKALFPVDEFLPSMYIEHPREDVRAKYAKRIEAYALTTDIVLSPDETVLGSDTEQSEFIDV